jgi:hypothetical protein
MVRTGPEQHQSMSLELDKSKSLRALLKMPVGQMNVEGGTQKLADGDFTYNVAAWKPEVRYNSSGSFGDLTIEQNGPTSGTGDGKNRWDVRFNQHLPLDLRVECGAGEGRLDLGTLDLHSLEITMGVGTLRLDLRGKPPESYSVHIRGGVGEATVYLPRDVGISASASGGIGEISVSGLRKSGNQYVNDLYASAPVRIHLDVEGGIGTIKLIAD